MEVGRNIERRKKTNIRTETDVCKANAIALVEYYKREEMRRLEAFTNDMKCLIGDIVLSCLDEETGSYVYFIRIKDTNRVKIGKANNPKARLKQFQTGCGFELELACTLKFKSEQQAYGAEHWFHWNYEGNRVKVKNLETRNMRHTEWFELPDEIFPLDSKEMRKKLIQGLSAAKSEGEIAKIRKMYEEPGS